MYVPTVKSGFALLLNCGNINAAFPPKRISLCARIVDLFSTEKVPSSKWEDTVNAPKIWICHVVNVNYDSARRWNTWNTWGCITGSWLMLKRNSFVPIAALDLATKEVYGNTWNALGKRITRAMFATRSSVQRKVFANIGLIFMTLESARINGNSAPNVTMSPLEKIGRNICSNIY